jgi:hypothetical protein
VLEAMPLLGDEVKTLMDKDTITISMRRDTAHYLSMLLGDQLLEFSSNLGYEHIEPLRSAYKHVNEEIERALTAARE